MVRGLGHIERMPKIILKVQVSPLQAMKAHEGCGCKGPRIHSHGTRKR